MQPHDIYNTSSNIAYEARTPPNPDVCICCCIT